MNDGRCSRCFAKIENSAGLCFACQEKSFTIPMVSQPLITEEGFLNQACLNELGKAIENIKPAYDRLDEDPEWSTKRWTFLHEITGAFAKWAVRLHPYHAPEGLESVLGYLTACLKKEVAWETSLLWTELSLCDINKLLHDILMNQGIKAFDDWNRSKHSKETGEEQKTLFSSAQDIPKPECDFIDLGALLHAVCLDIRMERREHAAFNAEFEREHGKLED